MAPVLRIRHWAARLGGIAGVLLACVLPAAAQRVVTDSVLSRLMVQDIRPDAHGLLWIGTDEGAFRYDGQRLVPLRELVRTGPRLPAGVIYCVEVDSAGTVWLGGVLGLYSFEPASGRLRRVPLPAPPGRRHAVLRLLRQGGALWVGYGSDPFNVASVDLRHPARPARRWLRHPGGNVDGLTTDSAGWVVAMGAGRTWTLGPRGFGAPAPGRLITYSYLQRPGRPELLLPDNAHLSLPGSRWRVSLDALYEVLPNGRERPVEEWPASAMPSGSIRGLQVTELDSGWYWLRGPELWSVSLRGPRDARPVIRRQPLPFTPGLRLTLRPDADGRMLWAFPYVAHGTVRVYPTQAVAQLLPVVVPPPYTTRALSTRAIGRLPDGRLTVGTYSGVFTQAADSLAAPLRRWLDPNQGGIWFALRRLRSGYVVIANENGSFDLLADGRQQPLPWVGQHPEVLSRAATCLLEDATGRVWGGTPAGLFRIDPARRQVTRYGEANPDFPLHHRLVEALAEGPAGVLWVATNDGLFRLTVATGQLTRYGPTEPGARRLPDAETHALLVRHPDSVWVGTRNAGLLLLDPRRGVRRQLRAGHELPSDWVVSLTAPPPGRVLWLGTADGLVRYDPRTGRCTVLTTADGLATNELNRQSAWFDSVSNRLYVGGVGGVSWLDLGQSFAPPSRPRLLLTSLTQHYADGDTIRSSFLNGQTPTDGLIMGPGDAFLDLTLALTDYALPQRAQFSYRLLGSTNERPQALGTVPRLRLQGLLPGDYTLEISAVGGSGAPAANRLRVPLTVQTHWWRRPTTWALGTALLLGLGIGGAYLWQRAREAQLRAEQQLRIRLSADLHDEVGALLTRVTMRAELLQADGSSPDLDALIAESRSATATVRDIIWSVNTAADTVGGLADRLRDLLDQTARATTWRVVYDNSALPPDPATRLRTNVGQHVYLIGKEAVTNALKHGRGGTALAVSLSIDDAALTLTIVNDGSAAASTARASQGLRNMLHRAALIGGVLDAGPGAAGGWRVELRVPPPLA